MTTYSFLPSLSFFFSFRPNLRRTRAWARSRFWTCRFISASRGLSASSLSASSSSTTPQSAGSHGNICARCVLNLDLLEFIHTSFIFSSFVRRLWSYAVSPFSPWRPSRATTATWSLYGSTGCPSAATSTPSRCTSSKRSEPGTLPGPGDSPRWPWHFQICLACRWQVSFFPSLFSEKSAEIIAKFIEITIELAAFLG